MPLQLHDNGRIGIAMEFLPFGTLADGLDLITGAASGTMASPLHDILHSGHKDPGGRCGSGVFFLLSLEQSCMCQSGNTQLARRIVLESGGRAGKSGCFGSVCRSPCGERCAPWAVTQAQMFRPRLQMSQPGRISWMQAQFC